MKKFFKFILLLFVFSQHSFFSQDLNQDIENRQFVLQIGKNRIPRIPDLESKDFMFQEYSLDLQQFYIDLAAGKKLYINFYSYKVKDTDTLFSISARCNIPYDTIACINGIASIDYPIQSKELIIPAAAGLFILDDGTIKKQKAQNQLELLMQKKYSDKLDEHNYFCYNIDERYFFHIPEERLDQTTRAFFLDAKMRSPLDNYWLSSDYGYRQSPFGGANKQFHKGIDMAAPEGTEVYACKAGKVTSIVSLDVTFGNYIVIKHSNGLSSIYAHLSKVCVSTGDNVETGQKIGLVGKTGKVTGPHLHFEIRQNGQPSDPNAYIKR